MKTSSMARVGISARRMRRRALETEASMPMSEKTASLGECLWKVTWKFLAELVPAKLRSCVANGVVVLLETAQCPIRRSRRDSCKGSRLM